MDLVKINKCMFVTGTQMYNKAAIEIQGTRKSQEHFFKNQCKICVRDVQTGSGAHSPSYPMDTRGYFPADKAAEA